ncbi:MAG: ATP-binding protein [Spirochaetes bacterium]|nr:ATP-binding protein [Spirochaetota bacterium]
MEYMEINSDLSYVRNISKSIISHAKSIADHFSLTILEEQISEIIKNAIGHGNQNNIGKRVKLWYAFSNKIFKIIVEDEGEGFKNLEQWNDFNRKRNEALKAGNMEEMLKYMQYRGPDSTDMDGGNSLFAALEYWDNGLVYNNKKNKVVAVKYLY